MARSVRPILVLAVAAIAVATVSLRASDPCGAYLIVNRAVLEPNSTEPFTAQIFGAFSFAVPRKADRSQPFPAGSFGRPETGDVYGPVQKGYLFYACPKGSEAACQAEWNDLAKAAGSGEVIGFGSRYAMTGRVRPTTEKPANPDVYPLNVGLTKMGRYAGASYPDLVAALKAASRSK